MSALQTLLSGNVPEVPLTVSVDNNSIARLAGAAIITAVIILLIAKAIKQI